MCAQGRNPEKEEVIMAWVSPDKLVSSPAGKVYGTTWLFRWVVAMPSILVDGWVLRKYTYGLVFLSVNTAAVMSRIDRNRGFYQT